MILPFARRGAPAVARFAISLLSSLSLFSSSALRAEPPAVTSTHPSWAPCLPFVPKGCEVAVLRGDPNRTGSQVLYRMPANFAVPSHWHTSAERTVLVSGKLRLKYDGSAPEILAPGDSVESPGKMPHAAFCFKGAPCVVLVEYSLPFDAVPVASGTK
ncbi:MAG: cupin domain-containing protein [Acidobacteriota bacterium]